MLTPRGRQRATRPGSRPVQRPGVTRQRAAAVRALPRPKLTGRFAVLVLVVAVLVVSYASSMRAYLQQRHQISQLNASIAASEARISSLQREKQRWADPAYVMSQARERFGFILPGEVGYQVLDRNGKPLGYTDSLSKPASSSAKSAPLWWQSTLGSIGTAGVPPKPVEAPSPATEIRPPKPGS